MSTLLVMIYIIIVPNIEKSSDTTLSQKEQSSSIYGRVHLFPITVFKIKKYIRLGLFK